MNEDIVEVATGYADVAELGQGYVERVDGERILLPLGQELPDQGTVRFIVHLADGTPAFAGSGRCIQVSDQGTAVAENERYETLLDSLSFDERSAPVYEYIVAVRQMAYAEAEPEPEGVPPVETEAAAAVEAEAEVAADDTAGYAVDDAAFRAEAVTRTLEDPGHAALPRTESMAPVSAVETYLDEEPQQHVAASPAPNLPPPDLSAASSDASSDVDMSEEDNVHATPLPPALQTPSSIPTPLRSPVPSVRTSDSPRHAFASLAPAALPTGILTRPAISAQWAAVAARPEPTLPRSKQFQTAQGPLQIPAAPPRPQLDRSQWVERAPAPARAAAH